MRVAVIGAGIVGSSCALFLQRDGHEVTLIDPREPGTATSLGNAGIISLYSILPVGTPATVRKLPSMLADPVGPLEVRWRHLPTLAPWLARFLANCRPSRQPVLTAHLNSLLSRVGQAHDVVIQQCGLADLVRPGGWLKVAQSMAVLKDSFKAEMAAYDRFGLPYELLEESDLRAMEPALGPDQKAALHLVNNRAVRYPQRYVEGIAGTFFERGGQQLKEEVKGYVFEGNRITHVATTGPQVAVDAVVQATGAYGKKLAAIGGAHVPLEAERGYHLMLSHPEATLSRPVYTTEGAFVLAPMDHGMRLTGGVELASPTAPPDYRRVHRLLPQAHRVVPGLAQSAILSQWQGARPSLPDSLPVIGRSPETPNLVLAFGHQHVGLTMGPLTGMLVADILAERAPSLDLTPFAVDRSMV